MTSWIVSGTWTSSMARWSAVGVVDPLEDACFDERLGDLLDVEGVSLRFAGDELEDLGRECGGPEHFRVEDDAGVVVELLEVQHTDLVRRWFVVGPVGEEQQHRGSSAPPP